MTGNTERTALSGSARVILDRVRWTHEFRARADFAEDQDETTEQRVFASLETNYKIDARLYIFGKASYEDDRFSGFDYRITETAGVGYRLIDTDDVTFKVELGPGARQTRIQATDEFENEAVGSLSGDFAWRVSEGHRHDCGVHHGDRRSDCGAVLVQPASRYRGAGGQRIDGHTDEGIAGL